MHPAFEHVDHRPIPLPRRPWIMAMRWCDLLFAHWPVQVEDLRPHVPDELEIETFDGSAWSGITPFRMEAVRPRLIPPVLGMNFPEMNVRTYVRYGDRPGIWFFSLDAASKLAVHGARKTFRLPYYEAEMSCERRGDTVSYSSNRTHRGATGARFEATYAPVGPTFTAGPGSLEHFLTERYLLYSYASDTLFSGEIHHGPWQLRTAQADIRTNTMTAQIGLNLPARAPLLHFADRLDVVAWRLHKA